MVCCLRLPIEIKNTMKVQYIAIFDDNYIWLLVDEERRTAVAVDPGDSKPLLDYLSIHKLTLTAILITHHHMDHIGGVLDLKQHFHLEVYGPKRENIQGVTKPLAEGDTILLETMGVTFSVLEIPGHTLGHIAYYNQEHALLFCGDTLFSAGCGRIFEGTPAQMYASLQRLQNLPQNTAVYCTHEYTLANLKFAESVEPQNQAILNRVSEVTKLREQGLASLPSTLEAEKQFNPFLRCDSLERFTHLRKLKDSF